MTRFLSRAESWLFAPVRTRRMDWLALAVFVLLMLVALAGISSRTFDLERSVSELQIKPCLMTGAHTWCER